MAANYNIIFKDIESKSIDEARELLSSLKDHTIEDLYFEVASHKKKFPTAYMRLAAELDRRDPNLFEPIEVKTQ